MDNTFADKVLILPDNRTVPGVLPVNFAQQSASNLFKHPVRHRIVMFGLAVECSQFEFLNELQCGEAKEACAHALAAQIPFPHV